MESKLKQRFISLSVTSRVFLVGAIALLVLGVATAAWWVLQPAHAVLFANLQPRDAAVMTAELDRLKVPYHLSADGSTILVGESEVHKTRLKLLSKELPLNGVVGFEVFNASDFGMTEFAQRVNYQRALQGEITRTIMSIDAIQAARVHLAMPEQGLFKRQVNKPKASVTLTMKPGRTLDVGQISGIQRLVAASVLEIVPADVTILDQRGVALSRAEASDESLATAGTQLEMKRSVEDHLTQKLTQVLDRALGTGQALAVVDATINLDQNRVTTEEVLPARGARGDDSAPAGVLVRERQNSREAADANSAKGSGAMSSIESEYQVGRRTEQVTVAPGSLRRLSVAIVIRKSLDTVEVDRVKEVAAAAMGLSKERGDILTVQQLSASAIRTTDNHFTIAGSEVVESPAASVKPALTMPTEWFVYTGMAAVLALVAAVIAAMRRPRSRSQIALSNGQRDQVLLNLSRWLNESEGTNSAKRGG